MDDTDARLIACIAERADRGERAPTLDNLYYLFPDVPAPQQRLQKLCREGHVRIEVYSLNWRVIEILTGEHKGKRTKACPRGGKPYRVLDYSHERVA